MSLMSRSTPLPRPMFEEATAGVARAIGRNECQVLFQGDEAYSTEDKIVIPIGDANEIMSPKDQRIVAGYANHELSYHRYGDVKELHSFMQKNAKKPMLKSLAKTLEGIRCERQLMADYGGAQVDLAATSRAVDELALEHLDEASFKDPRKILPAAIAWEGRKRNGTASEVTQKLLDQLAPEIRQRAEKVCDALTAVRGGKEGTKDVLTMAEMLLKEIEKEQDGSGGSPNPSSSDGKGGSGGSPNPSFGDGKDGSSGEKGGSDGEKDGGRKSRKSKGGGMPGVGGAMTEIKPFAEEEPFDPDYRAIFKGAPKPGDRNRYIPWSRAHDRVHTQWDKARTHVVFLPSEGSKQKGEDVSYGRALANPSGLQRYEECRNQMSAHLATMRQKLMRALLAEKRRGWLSDREAGMLDTRRLVQAFQGEPYVFKERKPVRAIDTAVTLLVDQSGSMYGKKIMMAQTSTIALLEALLPAGVAVEVLGFTARYGQKDYMSALRHRIDQGGGARIDATGEFLVSDSSVPAKRFSRWEALDHFVYKAFDEQLRVAKRAIGNMTRAMMGNNIDGESVMWAYSRLAQRREKRKILLVLSDGEPAAETSFGRHHLFEHLRNVVAYIDKHTDVQLCAIGILSDAVSRFYPRYQVLEELDDLPKSIMDNIARMLLGERFVVDNADLIPADKDEVKRMRRRAA